MGDLAEGEVSEDAAFCVPDGGFALLSNVHIDPTNRFSVSVLHFDAHEELLWTGSTGVTVHLRLRFMLKTLLHLSVLCRVGSALIMVHCWRSIRRLRWHNAPEM